MDDSLTMLLAATAHMQIQRREMRRRTGGLPYVAPAKPTRELTPIELRALAAAQEKRERRAEKRMK